MIEAAGGHRPGERARGGPRNSQFNSAFLKNASLMRSFAHFAVNALTGN